MIERAALLRKGLPAGLDAALLGDQCDGSISLLDDRLALPVAILKDSALSNNRRWMQAFLARSGVVICPHGKTHMSPQLFAMQLADGAWGITAATAHHVRVYAEIGIKRIFLANQIVGEANFELILTTLSDHDEVDFYCLIDSIENVRALAAAVNRHGLGKPIKVLVELGSPGARTGVRTMEGALAVAAAAQDHAGSIALVGIEIFEGVFKPGPDSYQHVSALQARLLDTAGRIEAAGMFAEGPLVLSAGGSVFFDMSARMLAASGLKRDIVRVIRPGCYLTHDHRQYRNAQQFMLERSPQLADLGRLEPALEVWAHVQSKPEPGMVIVSLGKRDISADLHPPLPIATFRKGIDQHPMPVPNGIEVEALYDQHAVLRHGCDWEVQVGDMVGFGISHPCTTFDKWKMLLVVDENYAVTGFVDTLF